MIHSRHIFFAIARQLLLVASLMSLASCGSMFPVRSYSIQSAMPDPASSASRSVALFNYGKPVTEPYKVLGKVMAFKRGGLGAVRELDYRSPVPEEMLVGLKQQASGLGANAVIGVYHGEYRGTNVAADYASGLAVQLGDAVHSAGRHDVFRVGILPVQIGKAKLDKKDYAVLDRDFRNGARWFLEDKGYYAPLDTAVQFHGNLASLQAMQPSTLQQLYGKDTDLLLLIEMIDEQALKPLLVEYRKVVLRASLYSKSLHKVLWENQVQNENVSGIFWSWMAEAVTRSTTIEAVLKPLPFYARGEGASEYAAFPPESVKKFR